VTAEFAVNNKTHSATKVSPFMVNYGRVEDRSRYKKKGKNRESNRICSKNEESVRGSRGGIEESSERNKNTSR